MFGMIRNKRKNMEENKEELKTFIFGKVGLDNTMGRYWMSLFIN